VRVSEVRASTVLPLALAAVLTLAACGPVDPPAARPPDRPPVQVDGSLGVVRIPRGEPVVVRLVIDGEGDPEALGPIVEAAFRAAIEDFGVVQQGFRVTLGPPALTGCDRDDGERAGLALAQEADDARVVAVLGPQCSQTLLGLQGPVADAGLVVVVPRAQDLTLTEGVDGLPAQDRASGTWRTAPSLLLEARAAAAHAAEELELTRGVVIHDGSIESAGLAAAFRTRFEALGGTVVLFREIDPGITEEDEDQVDAALDALLDAVAAGDADVAFLPLRDDALLALADGWSGRSRLAAIARYTTSRAASETFLGDEASLGHLLTGPALDFSGAVSAVTGMSASQTLERVAARTGTAAPSGWWAYAYDAATLLLKAIEDASLVDVDGSLVIGRADLRATLASVTFGGLTGPLACTPLGDCAPRSILIRSHEDASVVMLDRLPVVGTVGD
jgi:branched-chain amino acid transport system substrate-binding protein